MVVGCQIHKAFTDEGTEPPVQSGYHGGQDCKTARIYGGHTVKRSLYLLMRFGLQLANNLALKWTQRLHCKDFTLIFPYPAFAIKWLGEFI